MRPKYKSIELKTAFWTRRGPWKLRQGFTSTFVSGLEKSFGDSVQGGRYSIQMLQTYRVRNEGDVLIR